MKKINILFIVIGLAIIAWPFLFESGGPEVEDPTARKGREDDMLPQPYSYIAGTALFLIGIVRGVQDIRLNNIRIAKEGIELEEIRSKKPNTKPKRKAK